MINGSSSGDQCKKIMLMIDESEASYHALIWVLKNLKDVLINNNSELVIFGVVPELNFTQSIAATFSSARLYSMAATGLDFCFTLFYTFFVLSSSTVLLNLIAAPELAISVQEYQMKIVSGLLEKAKNICTGQGVCIFPLHFKFLVLSISVQFTYFFLNR